ncbi:MAG: hypothetical protein ABIJ57_02670 [Pseudomonadota bacterium]
MDRFWCVKRCLENNAALMSKDWQPDSRFLGNSSAPSRMVWVSHDLPSAASRFVCEHEIYHLDDRCKWTPWREVKANAYAAAKHPVGAAQAAWMTVRSWERIKAVFLGGSD